MFRIECLPAAHGDAIWIEWGTSSSAGRMLVDAGPAARYDETVRARLAALAEGERHLDVFAVSHIDSDHIDGAVLLLQDKALGVSIGDVWFNGYQHLVDAAERFGTFGPKQGEFLAALLGGRRWNHALGGEPFVVPPAGKLPIIRGLPSGVSATLLSPGPQELIRLKQNWASTIAEAGWDPGAPDAALARLAQRKDMQPPLALTFAKSFGNDTAPANGSSMAFILEGGGKRVLLAGDAHAPVLTEGLKRYATAKREQRVKLDLVKVAHHGSMANIDDALLATIDCTRFAISTSGAVFGHPDHETIELIARTVPGATIYFNYRSDTTAPFEARAASLGINVVYPPDGAVIDV